jgi:hypothetical protein
MAAPVMVFTAPNFYPMEFQRLLDASAPPPGGGVTMDQVNAAIAAAVAPLNDAITALTARVAALEAAAAP